MASRTLTPKQQRFVDEYLVDLNATAAAARAGYKKPNQQGPRLLVNVGVAEAIARAQATRSERTRITADRVLDELALLGFSDVGQVLDFSETDPALRPACEIPEAARRAIASVKVKRYLEGAGDNAREVEVTEFKLWDKLSALEKIGRHLGMFREKVEHAGKVEHEHSGTVDHGHHVDPAALKAFAEDLALAGLRDLPKDGGQQPVDPAPAPSQAAAVPSA